jgi:hypothetical protein
MGCLREESRRLIASIVLTKSGPLRVLIARRRVRRRLGGGEEEEERVVRVEEEDLEEIIEIEERGLVEILLMGEEGGGEEEEDAVREIAPEWGTSSRKRSSGTYPNMFCCSGVR